MVSCIINNLALAASPRQGHEEATLLSWCFGCNKLIEKLLGDKIAFYLLFQGHLERTLGPKGSYPIDGWYVRRKNGLKWPFQGHLKATWGHLKPTIQPYPCKLHIAGMLAARRSAQPWTHTSACVVPKCTPWGTSTSFLMLKVYPPLNTHSPRTDWDKRETLAIDRGPDARLFRHLQPCLP